MDREATSRPPERLSWREVSGTNIRAHDPICDGLDRVGIHKAVAERRHAIRLVVGHPLQHDRLLGRPRTNEGLIDNAEVAVQRRLIAGADILDRRRKRTSRLDCVVPRTMAARAVRMQTADAVRQRLSLIMDHGQCRQGTKIGGERCLPIK